MFQRRKEVINTETKRFKIVNISAKDQEEEFSVTAANTIGKDEGFKFNTSHPELYPVGKIMTINFEVQEKPDLKVVQ